MIKRMERDFEEYLKAIIEDEREKLRKQTAEELLAKAIEKEQQIIEQLSDLPLIVVLGILDIIRLRIYTHYGIDLVGLRLEKSLSKKQILEGCKRKGD